MAMVRGHVGKSADAENNQVRRQYDKLADAWDHCYGYRSGDKAQRLTGGKRKRDSAEEEDTIQKPRPHPNQWGLGYMMRMAIASIGQSKVPRQGISGSTHAMTQISVTASIGEFCQQDAIDKWFHRHVPLYDSLVLQRGFDATPIEVSFGSLSGALRPYARYFVLERGEWKLKSYEEMQINKRGSLTYGRIELLAQTVEICWSEKTERKHEWQHVQHQRKTMSLPTILQRCSASCIDSAVNKSIRPLSTEMLIRLARNVKWILLHEVPDNHSANVLKRKAISEVLAATPNILFPPGGVRRP